MQMFDYDGGTEAEYLTSQGPEDYRVGRYFPKVNGSRFKRRVDNTNRYRCLSTGCNPVMYGEEQAAEHKQETGHRTAKWPVRSDEGERKSRRRNRTGHYNKYNTGDKSYAARQHLI